MFLGRGGRIQVLVQPIRNRGLQGEMQFDFFAIQRAPNSGKGLPVRVHGAKLNRTVLYPILIERAAVLRSDPETAQA